MRDLTLNNREQGQVLVEGRTVGPGHQRQYDWRKEMARVTGFHWAKPLGVALAISLCIPLVLFWLASSHINVVAGDVAFYAQVAAIITVFVGYAVHARIAQHKYLSGIRAAHVLSAEALRTPLATASMMAHAFASKDLSPAQFEQIAERLESVVRAMNQHLDTQLANTGNLGDPVPRESVPVAEVIQEVIAKRAFKSTRERKCVEILVRREFSFAGSRRHFSQVIENVLANSFDALASHADDLCTGDVLIEVGTFQNRGKIVVTDRGSGIKKVAQGRAFDPLFTTKPGRAHGLGLAFCRRVVGTAGGTVHLESGGRGTRVSIDLPALDQ